MKIRNFYIIAFIIVIIDQITKRLVTAYIPYRMSIPVIGRILYLSHEHNKGSAFGMLGSSGGVLALVTIVVVVFIIFFMRMKHNMPLLVSAALAFELGGAAGNLIDRLRLGYVVDFIDVQFWPIFNVADITITLGIFLLAYHLLFVEGRNSKSSPVLHEKTSKDS